MQNENARTDSRLELAPEWRPDEAALIQPKPDPKAALADFETPQWTVEGADKPTPQAPSGRNLVSSSKLVAIRGGAAPNDPRPAHHGSSAQRDTGTIHNFSAAQRNPNASSSLGTSQRNASTIYGLDTS